MPLVEERYRALDRLVGGVARQWKRRFAVRHALAEDHADPGVLVRLQARVRELGGPGIHEADRAVLDELDQAEQRREVFLLLGHGHLELEHVGERAREVVGEDPAHRVGVADVHVAVEEARRHDQVPPVDHPIGPRVRQPGRLAQADDAAVVDDDRAVLDDPPLAIDGEDVAGVVDLEVHHRPWNCGRRFSENAFTPSW